MRTALIGSTGFIGGNLTRQFPFDELYNSSNISDIRGREFGLLVCGGVTAVKWWANQNPLEDRRRIDMLIADLAHVRASRVIVLSTIDVYPRNNGIDETFDCRSLSNHAYGSNRLYFEDALKYRFPKSLIVRIAGVFGPGLKKNVIYDLLHGNLLDALNPDSSFQYYNVSNLWRDLQRLNGSGIDLVNFVNPPLPTRLIIDRLFPGKKVGLKAAPPVHYDVRTIHSGYFDGPPGYLASSEAVMNDLASFVNSAGAIPV